MNREIKDMMRKNRYGYVHSKELAELLNKLEKCSEYDDEVLLIKQQGATLLLDYIRDLESFANKNNLKVGIRL